MANEIYTYRGDNLNLRCTFTQNSSAYDLTSHTLFATVKGQITDTDATAALTSTITTFDAATSGVQIVSWTAAQTNDLTPKTYTYDLQLKDGSDAIITVVKGNLKVLSDVTRRTS